MRRRLVPLELAFVGALLAASALAGSLEAQERTDQDALVHDRTAFAVALYDKVRGKDGNVFFSPQSIWTTLAMVGAGARGETAREITSALCMSVPRERLYRGNTEASRRIARKGYELRAASSLFGQAGASFQPEFLDVLANRFGAPLLEVDFKHDVDGARKKINGWVAEKTGGMIGEILGANELDPDCGLALANAVFFKAQWQAPFPKAGTRDGSFHAPGKDVQAPLMHDTLGVERAKGFAYAETDWLQVLSIPYAGEEVSLVVFLPGPKDKLARLEAELTPERLATLFAKDLAKLGPQLAPRGNPTLELTLPRFHLRWHASLEPVLRELGLKRLFALDAELDGIFVKDRAHITRVVHEAVVELDEQGTQAAAATVGEATISFGDNSPPPPQPIRFTADRPFLFLLRHNPTGLIFFMGRVVDPTKT